MNLRAALLPFLFASSSSSSSSHDDNVGTSASSLSSSSASSSAAYGSEKKLNDPQQKMKLRLLHDPSPSSELRNRQDHRINGDGSTGSDASKKKHDIGRLDHDRVSKDRHSDEASQSQRELESREEYCGNLCSSGRQEIQDNAAFKSLVLGNVASIGCWNTSAVTDMNSSFVNNDFNEKINCWDVSNVTTMYKMFWFGKKFNQPLDDWNVARVNDMGHMFNRASVFNQPISNWNVAKVDNMSQMFFKAESFNQPLNDWNVAKVTDMIDMFHQAESFDQPVDDWNVSKVTDMSRMFLKANSFNQCISSWAEKTSSTLTNFLLAETDCPISKGTPDLKGTPDPDVGPWCRDYDCPTSSPTSAPTLSLAPTNAPTSAPTASPTGACDNSADFDCAKHVTGFKKRKCSKKIRTKWGVGLKFKDVCPQMCKGQLCTCVDSVEKFSIKGVEGDHTCAGLIGTTNCKKFTGNGFGVNKICPNQCLNTKKCINAP